MNALKRCVVNFRLLLPLATVNLVVHLNGIPYEKCHYVEHAWSPQYYLSLV